MSGSDIPMPRHDTADMGEKDILDELLDLLEGNGDIPDETRNKILIKAQIEVLRRLKRIEKETIVATIKREPVKALIYITAGFMLLHEFSTYVNISLFVRAAARMLGVPIE